MLMKYHLAADDNINVNVTLLLMILRNWISGMRPVFAGSKVLQIWQLAMTRMMMMRVVMVMERDNNDVFDERVDDDVDDYSYDENHLLEDS